MINRRGIHCQSKPVDSPEHMAWSSDPHDAGTRDGILFGDPCVFGEPNMSATPPVSFKRANTAAIFAT